jgi:hypothetical protein
MQGHMLFETARRKMLRRGAGGRAAACVQGDELLFLCNPRYDEHVAANPGAFRFEEVHNRCGRNGRVEGIAALFQNLQACLGRQWLTGSDHTIARENLRSRLSKPTTSAIAANRCEIRAVGGLAQEQYQACGKYQRNSATQPARMKHRGTPNGEQSRVIDRPGKQETKRAATILVFVVLHRSSLWWMFALKPR